MKTAMSVLAIALVLGWLGPAIDDNSLDQAMADELEQAQREAQAQERFDRAARQVCGENAGYRLVGDGSIRCTTKRGHPLRMTASIK